MFFRDELEHEYVPLSEPKGLGLLLLSLLCLGCASPAELTPRIDAEGVVRLLHLGKAWVRPGYPATVWIQDPRISYYPVPSHAWSMGEEAFRSLRLYLPRTEKTLYDNFDVIVEDGMDASHLPHEFHKWVKKGVEKEGMGFLMADDSSSFATSGRHTSWYLFPIGDILPVTDVAQIFREEHGYHIAVDPKFADHPLMRNLPWNEIRIWAHNRPDPKEGAIVLAWMSPEIIWNRNKPVIVYWDYGNGRSVAYVHKWHGTPNFYRWRWHLDVLSHMIYFPARVKIPQDLELVHQIRSLFNTFHYKKTYLTSTMDFADKFGANLAPVEGELVALLSEKKAVDREYIEQDLQRCYQNILALVEKMDMLTQEVLEAKDKALLWIFISEWLAVSGTSMFAGFILWTLMVRKRLYREVEVTRLIER